jgi:hypothetical protein
MYGYRHFVQALLVRKLLWEHLPAERIAGLMAGRSTEEAKRMLFGGVEMVARQSGGVVAEDQGRPIKQTADGDRLLALGERDSGFEQQLHVVGLGQSEAHLLSASAGGGSRAAQ